MQESDQFVVVHPPHCSPGNLYLSSTGIFVGDLGDAVRFGSWDEAMDYCDPGCWVEAVGCGVPGSREGSGG